MALPILAGAAAVAAIGYLASKESNESKEESQSLAEIKDTENPSAEFGTEHSAEKKLNEYLDSQKMTNRLTTYSYDELWEKN